MELPEFADHYLGNEPGQDLANAGPATAAIARILGNAVSANALIASIFWQAFLESPAFTRALASAGLQSRPVATREPLIACHGPMDRPRYDLIVFDRRLQRLPPQALLADASHSDLRSGWAQFRSSLADEGRSEAQPSPLRSVLPLAADAAIEAAQIEQFGLIFVRDSTSRSPGVPTPPHEPVAPGNRSREPELVASPVVEYALQPGTLMQDADTSHALQTRVYTAGAPNFPWAVTDSSVALVSQDQLYATVGVFARDTIGQHGATVSHHFIHDEIRSPLTVQIHMRLGSNVLPGTVFGCDPISDSCFVTVEDSTCVKLSILKGPLRERSPYGGEQVTFEGYTSGRVSTHITGFDHHLPWNIDRRIQRIIETRLVTRKGDSGSSLINDDKYILGFAFYLDSEPYEYSAWIWADSVFNAHNLQ